jgi:hypothetical protein
VGVVHQLPVGVPHSPLADGLLYKLQDGIYSKHISEGGGGLQTARAYL